MKEKNKVYLLLVILMILIFLCKLILNVKTLNYKLKYNKETFSISETYKNKNYYIEIKYLDKVYPIRINSDKNKRKIVNKIYSYKDNDYECILPLINDEIKIDILCYKDNILYNYKDIIGLNSKLDEYIKNIGEYEIDKFSDNISVDKTINTIKYYKNNIVDRIVAITTYKGLIISGMGIELFKNDVYNNKISAFVDNYYLIANYDNIYDFDYFYVVNLTTRNIEKIKLKDRISLDSYIQGIVDNKVYLYDKDNEKQYKIDVIKKEIDLISLGDNIKYYKNNKWEFINKSKANKEIYFDYTSLSNNFTDYDQVKESDYYYYLFKKIDDKYNLYRVDKNNLGVYKYIGNIPTLSINTKDNYIYYVYNNKLYYYSDNTGLKTLLEDAELSFNNTIKYYIY